MNADIKEIRSDAQYIAKISREVLKDIRPLDAGLADLVESFGQAADAVVGYIKERNDR